MIRNCQTLLEEVGVAAWRLPEAAMRWTPPHRHAEAQLCGLDAGLAILETDAGAWLCPPGRCVWIPAGAEHSLRSCGKISGWMLHLSAEKAEGLPATPGVLAFSPLLKQIVLRMEQWSAEPVTTPERLRLIAVLRDEVAAAQAMPLHLPMPRDTVLKRTAARLAAEREEAGPLAAIAREVGLSERSLFRRFQEETGMSPGQWRKQMQVLRSMELLLEGRSVTETAMAVGYESTGAFIRAFRRVAGVTPAVYARGERVGSAIADGA